jgi:hypothetical protein
MERNTAPVLLVPGKKEFRRAMGTVIDSKPMGYCMGSMGA